MSCTRGRPTLANPTRAIDAAYELHNEIAGLPSDDGVGPCPACHAIARTLTAFAAEQVAECQRQWIGLAERWQREEKAAADRLAAIERDREEKAAILATFEGRCACGFEPSVADHDKQHSIWDMDRRR